MKTLPRLYLILAILVLCCAVNSVAHAQTWYVAPNTTPVDSSQLPYSVNFTFPADGWPTSTNTTWYAIWPRNASGAWYRPSGYTQENAYKSAPIYPFPYSCRSVSGGFLCRDLTRNADRSIQCPATIQTSPLRLWRSQYRGEWPELGLFTADRARFACNPRKLYLAGSSVTNNGKQINCLDGPPTAAGPGLALDVWCYRY